MPVDQVEDGVTVRLPLHALVETLSLDSVQHELQQVQLDWLLNEHDVVLRHDCREDIKYYTHIVHKYTNTLINAHFC